MTASATRKKAVRLFGNAAIGFDAVVNEAIESLRESGKPFRNAGWTPHSFDVEIVEGVDGIIVLNRSISSGVQIAVKRGIAKIVAYFDLDRMPDDAMSSDDVRLHVAPC